MWGGRLLASRSTLEALPAKVKVPPPTLSTPAHFTQPRLFPLLPPQNINISSRGPHTSAVKGVQRSFWNILLRKKKKAFSQVHGFASSLRARRSCDLPPSCDLVSFARPSRTLVTSSSTAVAAARIPSFLPAPPSPRAPVRRTQKLAATAAVWALVLISLSHLQPRSVCVSVHVGRQG